MPPIPNLPEQSADCSFHVTAAMLLLAFATQSNTDFHETVRLGVQPYPQRKGIRFMQKKDYICNMVKTELVDRTTSLQEQMFSQGHSLRTAVDDLARPQQCAHAVEIRTLLPLPR